MDFISVEKKWNKIWAETKLYSFDKNNTKNKHYVLEMFSYPSGYKLHIGHWYNYALSDSYARYMRANGKNVFQPMGFDAFGLPAENFAISTGIHPMDSTMRNIEYMRGQLKEIGAMFDWDYEVVTCLSEYYKWTQWMFLQLYKHGLAYRKKAPVNWCPSCSTVLANEQVVGGECERCGTPVQRKDLTQWFFKITEYADALLEGLDKLDWPEKTKAMQKNWIGKSNGAQITFALENGNTFEIFTTRPDTLAGCTYAVLAPEHPLVESITTPDRKDEVNAYKEQAAHRSELERSTAKEKTGVFTGSYAINPLTNEKVPIWIGDYVLYGYGTGAIMAVPAHDERDYAFAEKYGLNIKRVIKAKSGDDTLPYTEYGIMVNSGEFDGLTSEEGFKAVIEKLSKQGKGKGVTNYRLRDWLVSRQRYWGAPIPVVYCPHCGIVPVPESELPVMLPYDVTFAKDGTNPLSKSESFVNTKCPICGADAKRETDTLDTFVCSSWYYLRYPDNKNETAPFDSALINSMLPVDKYIGGPEHACMHLLYARFFTKALKDMGYVDFDEPFISLVHQGIILGPDGNRMSKSKGNIISPDPYVEKYGSDVFRSYLAFGFKYIEGGPWSDDGIKAIARWLEKVERLVLRAKELKDTGEPQSKDKELNYVRNNTIKCASEDYKVFSFNTAVARMMELTNAMAKYDDGQVNGKLYYECAIDLIKLLAPIAPHISEELWEIMGQKYSVVDAPFPVCDESALVMDTVEYAVQINSKVRAKIDVPAQLNVEQIQQFVMDDQKIKELVEGKEVKKVIVVPKRLVNIIL
jgi:leucyl-tRNA synthetase